MTGSGTNIDPQPGSAPTSPALRLEDVAKSFPGHLGIGKTVAVDGLDLTVERGQIVGLLGPNGAGKTTTIKMLLGLIRADRGRIGLLGGTPADPNVRARIGYLPENPYFYDHLNASEFLDFHARLAGLPRDERRGRIERTLQRVGLPKVGRTALRKFSKGMVQRVGLAQAILHDPELVILDEPMSGLDPIGRREVRDLVLDLRAAGRTVLFSSHILQDAEMICDRVAILRDGRLQSEGRLDELIARGVSWIEISVRGPLPDPLAAELRSRDGERSLLRVADYEALTALLPSIAAAGGSVVSIWPKTETLEELFLRAVDARGDEGATR